MIRLCVILHLFFSLWLYPTQAQAISGIDNGFLLFQQPMLEISLLFNTSIAGVNISTANISLSNSSNFDSVCTFLNLNVTLFTNNVSRQHTFILPLSVSNNIRMAIGDNPDCFVNNLTTFLKVPPDFIPDFTSQTVYPLDPIPEMSPPAFLSSIVDLKTGVIILLFSEITLPNTFNISLLSLSDQSNPTSGLLLSNLVSITSVVGATDTYSFTLSVSQLPLVGQFCNSNCFVHLAAGTIIQDVFANALFVSGPFVQTAIFTPYMPSFFSGSFTSTPISPTQSNITILPPQERSTEVTGYFVYIFLNNVAYYGESCDFPLAYDFQRRVTRTQFDNLDPTPSLPPCINSTDYSCYPTQELSLIVNLSPGFAFRRTLITLFPDIQFNTTAVDSPGDIYNTLLAFQVETPPQEGRRKRGVAPPSINNRIIVRWQVDPSFCDNHQLTLYYGSTFSNLFAYINLDRNTTCVERHAFIYVTRDRPLIIPDIRITPSAMHNFVSPNSCINLRLPPLSPNTISFPFAVDRPVIDRISEVPGSNNINVDWIEFSPISDFTIDFYNVYIFPIYALKYNGVSASCSNVNSQTTNEDFTFSPTEYYRHGVNPPQDDFEFACPPPSGLALPYSCYSIDFRNRTLIFPNAYTYAQGIIVEAVTRQQSTNLVARVRSYPVNYTSFSLDLGRGGTGYQQYTWVSDICHTVNSFIFTQSSFVHNQLSQLFSSAATYPCNNGMGFDLQLTDFQRYTVNSNYITDIETTSGTVCLLGYESRPLTFNVLFTERSIDVVEFRYINYATVMATIQVEENYSNPVNIYTIPFQVGSLSGSGLSNFCPTASSVTANFPTTSIMNQTISNMNNLECVNTSNYLCTTVPSTIAITLPVFPGFDPVIRAAVVGSSFESDIMPSTFGTKPFKSLSSPDLFQLHTQQYASLQLDSPNSIRVQWNTEFYCAPDSYIALSVDEGGLVEPGRRRRELMLGPSVTIPCLTGSYIFSDLNFNTAHFVMGFVFFNSTVEFFPACPIARFLFPSAITTLPLLNQITIVNFSSIQVSWNAISDNITSYTLIAIPMQYTGFNQSIGTTFTPNTHPRNIENLNVQNPTLLFEMCLNSSQAITCSKVSTTELSSTISTIPGFTYLLGLGYRINNQNITSILGQYNPSIILSNEIAVSAFFDFYLFSFNDSICSSSARVAYYFDETNIIIDFPVFPCVESNVKINLSEAFYQFPQARILYIFPFTQFSFPGLNLTSPPISVGIFVSGQLNFVPTSASPMITEVILPPGASSSIYQATWTPSPPLPLQLQFESYVLYAQPFGTQFSFTDGGCPINFQAGEVVTEFSVLNSSDICPPSNGRLYFCGEFSALSAQLSALTLLNYVFQVEASYSGGLRAFDSNYTRSIGATQNLSSLELSYQATPVSIIISWNSQVSFCSNSQLHFISSTSGGEKETLESNETVACSSGTLTLQPLLPLTTYQISYILLFNTSGIQQEIERCIQSEISPAFVPSPTTSSFCTPTNPCGSVGQCSEGFSNSSYHCDCAVGYQFNGMTCADIDECSQGICQNAACLNNMGSFTCTCFVGYAIVNSTSCGDIDECEIVSNCVNGNCNNLLPPIGFECICDPGFEGASCTISAEVPTCPSITESNDLGDPVMFPATVYGSVATVSCSLINIELFGNVTRQCTEEGEWGPIDFTGCQRIIFVSIQATTMMSENEVLTATESEMLSDELVTATNVDNGPLFPGEVLISTQAVNAITQSLMNLSQDANALRNSLEDVQENVVETTSNILREENSPAFEAVTQEEAEMQILNLVEAIEDISILIGSVAQENQTIVIEISRPTVALIVTLVSSASEPLVLGSNLSMPAGANASALAASQTSVSIPASIFQASNESIAVSVTLFPSVQVLLMNIRVNTTEPETTETTPVSNSLATTLASINLITSSGTPITVLPEAINLTFALLNNTPIVNNGTFSSELRCVSSRILAQGFNFDFTTLSNPDDVPPGPVVCNVTHLTHFGVLVSVTSQNITPEETLALEIITYITCAASITCLLLSLAAYGFLWYKTRKQQENLFKKDATILHVNFAIALLLALVFFLSSSGGFGHDGWCTAIIILQYYFWLSMFTSSLMIGIYLLVKIFVWSSQRRIWYYLVLLTWTLPLPLIIITPSITHDYIINRQEMVCWFSKEPLYANLSFIVPMLVITLTNLVILIITAVVLFRISKNNKGMFAQMKGILIASFTLTPILGIPWLFSIAASTPTSAVSFLFTIILGLQGVIFFILYPLRTPEIIDYVIRCKSTKPVPSTKLSQSGTSHPTHSNPAALKFRVKRHDATTTASESAKHNSLEKEIPLEDIKHDVMSENVNPGYTPETDKPGNVYSILDPAKNEAEAHL